MPGKGTGLTQQELADAAVMTRSHISHIEAGRRIPFEQQAVMIREFALSFVPGILQTERYARAVLGTSFPPVGEQECDRLVVTRLERAKILTDPVSPVVWVLLDEAVLRRVVGGPDVMAQQLRHLVHLVESERVRVHVVPFALGSHPLMEGMLSIMSFEDQPPVAYSEGFHLGKLHDSPSVVRELDHRYALALNDAMPLTESLPLLRATAEGYEHHEDPDGPVLLVPASGWASFVGAVRAGGFGAHR
ncbi:Scr1 family TA system antitoxin-like transcriptional regulator [Streptomyces sp. NPDC102365]|uniref:Scr1 family TA system antitoxin-like transcriptional regulator n=1 Tax=Streptomyces sp. NPDC102365 TaxID=3366162 RepID=UPI00380ACF5C